MNKLVYLFELDSVRNSRMEAELGQKAMFNEIVNNGNQIALSFNQIADSKSFLGLLWNEEVYPHMLELAKKGVFRFSRYGSVKNPCQYIIDALGKRIDSKDENVSFLFSAVPIHRDDIEELKVLRGALMNSDLTCYDSRLEEDKRWIFLKRYVELILTLSMQEVAINEKREEPGKILIEVLCFFAELYGEEAYDFPESSILSQGLVAKAFHKIKEEIPEELLEEIPENATDEEKKKKKEEKSNKNNRTWWVDMLEKEYISLTSEAERELVYLVEAIVDLCYNYVVEDSVKGVSRHYQEGDASFENDFEHRLLIYWEHSKKLMPKEYQTDEMKYIHHFMKTDSAKAPNVDEVKNQDWALADRLIGNMSERKLDEEIREYNEEVYAADEATLNKEQRVWRRKVLSRVSVKTLIAVVLIGVYCIVDIGVGSLESLLPEFTLEGNTGRGYMMLASAADIVFKIVAFGIIGSLLSTIFKVPDVLDGILGIRRNVVDIYQIRKIRNNKEYHSYDGVIESEK